MQGQDQRAPGAWLRGTEHRRTFPWGLGGPGRSEDLRSSDNHWKVSGLSECGCFLVAKHPVKRMFV